MFVVSCNNMDFGFVWLNQGVEEMNQFLHVFRERLVVYRWQEWRHSHVETSDRLMFIGHFAPFMIRKHI